MKRRDCWKGTKMKLYWSPPMASLAILILAYELGIEPELVRMDLDTKRMEDGRELRDINPKNCLPVIERDDGSILTETAVILDWMAAQEPALRFTAPAHGEEHMRIMEWLVYLASEQHKLVTLLFWNIAPETKEAVATRVIERFTLPERTLASTDYLVGDRCTIADLYLFVMVRGSMHVFDGFDPRERYPNIHVWMGRMSSRPAVQRAILDHS